MSQIPLIGHHHFELDASERQRLSRVARRLRADEPQLARYDVFGPTVRPGLGTGPSFLFEDHSEAGGFPNLHSSLEYRSLLLADTGDLVAVEGPRDPDFEEYCRDVLELGNPEVVAVPPTSRDRDVRLGQRCLHSPNVMQRLVEIAGRSRCLNVIPYLGGGWTWKLAAAVAQETGAAVRVAAPPPRLIHRANDKLWFAERVAEVLGRRALPPTYAAFGPAALSRRVGLLARRFPRLVIKVPSGSGGDGNVVLEAGDIEGLGPTELQRHLVAHLSALGWSNSYPLAVGAWLSPVLESPSVQLWIPTPEDGPPLVEAIFTQSLQGPVGTFVGAAPAALPRALTDRIVEEAASLATLFQALGYFGRCSFDCVLTGTDPNAAELHWIECNPRWTAVSIAVTLANRLIGDWERLPFVLVQSVREPTRGRRLPEALHELRNHTFTRTKESGVVLMEPETLVQGAGLTFIAIGSTVEAARSEAQIATALLTDDVDSHVAAR